MELVGALPVDRLTFFSSPMQIDYGFKALRWLILVHKFSEKLSPILPSACKLGNTSGIPVPSR